MEAYQTHPGDLLGRDQARQEIHLAGQIDSDMVHRGHRGRQVHQNVGTRLGETDHAEGSSGEAVVGVADLVMCFLGETETVVPIIHNRVSSGALTILNKGQLVCKGLRRKATENIHTVLRSRWFNDLHPKMLHHRPIGKKTEVDLLR